MKGHFSSYPDILKLTFSNFDAYLHWFIVWTGEVNTHATNCDIFFLHIFYHLVVKSQFLSIFLSSGQVQLWVKDISLDLYKPFSYEEEYSYVQVIYPVYSSVFMITSSGICGPQSAVTNFLISPTSSLSFLLIYMYFTCHISVLSITSQLCCLSAYSGNWIIGNTEVKILLCLKEHHFPMFT